MINSNRHTILWFSLLCILVTCLAACANRGMGPQGGPKDETPPKMVKEVPENGTVNYHDKKIEITFDEYLQLNDVANQVLISPPQQKPPEVRAVGKKLTVTFDQDLTDSTTYTIDFGKAICDNNERNPMDGYVFSFATGPEIDTLQISGIVIDAQNLNPVPNVYVGIHRNLADSAFEKEPFTRIGRTNEKGEFLIKNIHQGTYRIYGLDDVSRDYMYQTSENLAIYDSLVMPVALQEGKVDTLFLADTIIAKMDSVQLDSIPHDTLGRYWEKIESKTVTVYRPDNILLKFFKEDKQRHYFVRCLREKPHFFQLIFAAPQDSMPQFQAIAFTDTTNMDTILWTDHACYQPSAHLDTITVWLTDSAVIRQNTLSFTMTYWMSDSLYNLQPQTDTVTALYRAPRLSEKAKAELEKKKAAEMAELRIRHNAKTDFDVYDTLRISSPTPIRDFHPEKVHLSLKKDTILKPLKIKPQLRDSSGMQIIVPFAWEPEKEYKLVIDSAAMTCVYGTSNDVTEGIIKVRSLEDYSTLIVKMENIDYRARIQLLNEKDVVVRELPVTDAGARFEYLKPTNYYMRLYIDENGDGKWTTGDWGNRRQPEPVYYFPAQISLRANWDFEESFDINAKPLLEQKPEALKSTTTTKK